jgi:hypothetical protein
MHTPRQFNQTSYELVNLIWVPTNNRCEALADLDCMTELVLGQLASSIARTPPHGSDRLAPRWSLWFGTLRRRAGALTVVMQANEVLHTLHAPFRERHGTKHRHQL